MFGYMLHWRQAMAACASDFLSKETAKRAQGVI